MLECVFVREGCCVMLECVFVPFFCIIPLCLGLNHCVLRPSHFDLACPCFARSSLRSSLFSLKCRPFFLYHPAIRPSFLLRTGLRTLFQAIESSLNSLDAWRVCHFVFLFALIYPVLSAGVIVAVLLCIYFILLSVADACSCNISLLSFYPLVI